MKQYVLILLSIFLFSCSHKISSFRNTASEDKSNIDVLMSPRQGEDAFNKLYGIISGAKKFVYLTVYSWSDAGLETALKAALDNGAEVKVVLDPAIKNSSKFKNSIPKLEAAGAQFKIATMNMHEKFVIVDDNYLINGSANFSGGAKNKYSENIIFHVLKDNAVVDFHVLAQRFKNEFYLIWNVCRDVVTNNEANAPQLTPLFDKQSPNKESSMIFYSSSMNWSIKDNKPTSKDFIAGKYQSLQKIKSNDEDEQTWVVRDALIDAIRKSEKSIYLSLNHFNIRSVSDELIHAVKRGVNVRLAVDNQEYKSKINDEEMTPQFVADWKKIKPDEIPPVRVKYYAHEPSAQFWMLNHHKFALFDYEVPEKTHLLSGSYNLSKNAEHNQFDNLVDYRTPNYRKLYDSFYEEFDYLWTLNRKNDSPDEDILKPFYTKNEKGLIVLHSNKAISLTWPEIEKLKKDVSDKVPGIFSQYGKVKNCLYFNPDSKQYSGCSAF